MDTAGTNQTNHTTGTARPAARPSADPLLELAGDGRLIAEYPRVQELLAGLDAQEVLRAGRALARLDPEEIARRHPAVPTVTVGITGHGTLSALVPALTGQLARHGLLLRPVLGDFDGYVFDLTDPSSALYAARPDLVLCVLDPAVVFDQLPVPWRPEDVERAAADRLRIIEGLAARFRAAGHGTLVLNTMPLLRNHTAQLVDARSRARLGELWREANARLLRLAADDPAVVVIDLDPLLADGVPASDARLSTYAKAHLTPELLSEYARETGHLARQLTGRTKKCLVLDLDDTLWGGVLGEDGVECIEVGDGYRGEAFLAFQRVVKQLGSQGVLLAAVSKNDPGPVRQALRTHPRMALREDDFVRVIANWEPKHDNLTALADTLGLGVDSFVFVDDSAYERGLVRRELPGVAVVDLNREPAAHIGALLHDGWFDVLELTGEDVARASRYRDEAARKSFLDGFDSITDYLHALDVTVRLSRVTEAEVARVSQLTLRTNQFNLTTVRLQPQDVRDLAKDPAALVLAVHARDRFGDNGLVGAVLARRDGAALTIDNFLLSCRVFSRGIEETCLARVLRHARDTGAEEVRAEYRPSARNHRVAGFYPRHGFVRTAADDTAVTYRHGLTGIAEPPAHVRLVESFEEL
ncbi:HAD-IIIC family phosphatase [Streptomyces sp. NPDC047082]|uniref:HAD-IIIC family phosphatase n=1 Tax=Streptomyces sp. NPDC047082 TaxID=3155259 RepID=UPI003406A401